MANLRVLRKDKGLTQAQLGQMSNVDRSVIIAIEKDTAKNVTVNTLTKLAKALNCSVNELM